MADTTGNRTYVPGGIDHAGAESIVALSSNGLGSERHVLRSSNGGLTWGVTYAPISETARARFHAVTNPVPDLIAVAGDSALFIDYDEFFNSQDKYWATLSISRDGGWGWTHRALDSNARLLDIDMCDGTHGIASLQTIGNIYYPDPTEEQDFLLYTDDAWITYERIPLPSNLSYVPQAICLTPTTFLISGYDVLRSTTVMMRTTDRGATWSDVAGFRSELTRFDFVDSLHGWGAGGVSTGIGQTMADLIARTTDGGQTWQTVLNEGIGTLKFGLMSIDFADLQNGIAVGMGNKILRTTDGGETWRQEYPPSFLSQDGLVLVAYPKADLAAAFALTGPIILYRGESQMMPPKFIRPDKPGPLPADSVLIEWSAVEGATQYRVEVRPDPIGDGFPSDEPPLPPIIDSVLEGRTLVVRDLSYWHRYFVRVKAIGPWEESDWWNHEGAALFFTIDKGKDFPPVIIYPAESAPDIPVDMVVRWRSIPEAMSYDLQIGYDQYFASGIVVQELGLIDTFFNVSGLTPGTAYFIRVRANLEEGPGDWSSRYAPHTFRTTDLSGVRQGPERADASHTLLALSPNPVRDYLTISVDRTGVRGPCELVLYDEQGKVLQRAGLEGEHSQTSIETGDLPSGTYRVHILEGKKIVAAEAFIVLR